MTANLSKFGSLSGLKYEQTVSEIICACDFEKFLSADQLIDFGDPVRPVMDCIEQRSTHQPVYCQMVRLFLLYKQLTVITTDLETPAEAQLPSLPNEVSKAESLLASFEQHQVVLRDWVRLRADASAKRHKYASSYNLIITQ